MSGESGVSLPNNAMVRPIGLGMGPLELRFRTPHTPKTHTPRLFKGLRKREPTLAQLGLSVRPEALEGERTAAVLLLGNALLAALSPVRGVTQTSLWGRRLGARK